MTTWVFVCVVTQSSAMSRVGLASGIPAPFKHWAVGEECGSESNKPKNSITEELDIITCETSSQIFDIKKLGDY